MSSDAPELAPSKDPAAYRRRGRSGLGVAGFVAFGVLCVLAGLGIARLSARLAPPAPSPAASAPVAPAAPEPAAPAAAIADLPAPDLAAPRPDVARLDARLTALERHANRTSHAAAAALAAAAVVEASQTSRPFAGELAALRAVAAPSPELAALARYAETGAPGRVALAASFPDYAARASTAARAPGEKAGLGARIIHALSRIITLRRVGEGGSGPDALLARAERQLQDGDVEAALHTLRGLPPGAREAIAPWRSGAERRAELDRIAGALRARALQDLAGAEAPSAEGGA